MSEIAVLVVDDSLIMRKKISLMLTDLGHKVVATAASGAEAIKQCAQYRPDVVTMDIVMPDMNGIDATREILSKMPNTMIIMVTSVGQETMVMEAIKAGAKGYVLKPIDKDRLATLIEGMVEHYA